MKKRIAIPTRGTAGLEDQVEEHFGRAQHYTLINVDDGKIVNTQVLDVPFAEHGPGDLPNWIHAQDADAVLAWGMGPSAVVEGYIRGNLETIEWVEPEGHGEGHGHHH